MGSFLVFAFLFFIGCTLGWTLELVYRRFSPENKSHRWINPGFLTGPYLPLYGFGLCILYSLAECERFIHTDSLALRRIAIILIMAAALTLIEYIAGVIFVRGMHVKLWDYSNRKFNIQGIICPLFSFFWGVLAAVYYIFVHRHIMSALEWFSRNLAFSFVIGMFFGVFVIDVFYSFGIVVKIKKFADENRVLVRYEEFKEHIQTEMRQKKEKYRFIFALHTSRPITEHLRSYVEKQRSKLSELTKKDKNI